MEAKENEIIFLYNSEKQQDRKALGYAGSVEDHKLNERDITKSNLTETQLAEIAEDMQVKIAALIDKNSEYYLNELKNKSFEDNELTKIMVMHPQSIKTPIAYVGRKVFFVDSAYSFVQQDIEIEGVKSDKGNAFEKKTEDRNM